MLTRQRLAGSTIQLIVALAALVSCTKPSERKPEPSPKSPPPEVRGAISTEPTRSKDSGLRPELPVAHDAGATEIAPASSDFVDIQSLIPAIILDIRYASKNNFVGKKIYSVNRCLLRRPVAEALHRVQNTLKDNALQLVIWDCYRPFEIQEQFWELYPDKRYVAKPVRRQGAPWKGSKHNRGAAIDLTLADQNGIAILMPTDHDDFSARAHRGATQGISPKAIENAEALHAAMTAEGFKGIPTEWWHFDHHRWREFPLAEGLLAK